MAVQKDFFTVVIQFILAIYVIVYAFATTFAIYYVIGFMDFDVFSIMLVGFIVIIVRKKYADTQIGNLAGNANTTRAETIRNFNLNLPAQLPSAIGWRKK